MVGCARVVFRAVRLICSMPDCLGLFVVGGAHRLSSFAMTPQLRVNLLESGQAFCALLHEGH